MASNNQPRHDNDDPDPDEDNDCPACGGSGGGPDEALKCLACGGSGRRVNRSRYVSDDPDDYDPDYITRRFGR